MAFKSIHALDSLLKGKSSDCKLINQQNKILRDSRKEVKPKTRESINRAYICIWNLD